tara:strand:+ start:539 stop:751 length:213 start_codon:yes stop_codon:yes gene_type:complete
MNNSNLFAPLSGEDKDFLSTREAAQLAKNKMIKIFISLLRAHSNHSKQFLSSSFHIALNQLYPKVEQEEN